MKIALTAFTRRGAALVQTLLQALETDGHACCLAFGQKLAAALETDGHICRLAFEQKTTDTQETPHFYSSLAAWTQEQFSHADALVFVGASGIAVRAIAPFVRDKFTDPSVVSLDEAGQFVVPLLSGHVGGANELARRMADITGGTAVISTATDINGIFAVDVWAVRQGFAIMNRTLAKEISAALLEGKQVGFASDFPMDCPPGLFLGSAELGVWVTAHTRTEPFPRTLRLVPKCLTLGIGCRRGTAAEHIRAAVEHVLDGWDWSAIKSVATIDLKKNEPGLLAFCRELGVCLTVYTAQQLQAVPGEFTPSAFVKSVTGVDNVCERAAAQLGGELVVPKQTANGVTVAVALDREVIRKKQ